MELVQVGTILDLDLEPFLNKGLGPGPGFDLKFVLLVRNLVRVRKFKSGSETGFT